MFRNYLKVAWRNLWKNRVFSFINITGLASGLVCFLLISLFVTDELSYDKFFPKADRIYRINANIRFGGADLNYPLSSDMMGQVLKKDYPQVENFARLYNSDGSKLVKKGNEFIDEENICYADSTFFRLFDLPALSGDLQNALNDPDAVVISEKTAKKYFGGVEKALNRTLETNYKGKTLYRVTAVIRDIPHNAHFNFDFFFSMKSLHYDWGNYLSHNFHTYLLLRKGTDYRLFERKFPEYINKYCLPVVKQIMQINSMDDFSKAGNRLEYNLTPLTSIHLYSTLQYEFLPGGNIEYIYIFSAVALFILLIACINFMNLTTARSANRAKEVGIRKVLGSERKELVGQFLVESTIMAIISLLIAIATTCLALPLFNNIADKTIALSSLFSPALLALFIALPLVVGLIAGSYPAFFLSSFKPIEVLKGKLRIGGKSGNLRNILVIFQFGTSIALIIGTIVIYRQLHFIQTKDLGYNKEQVLIINETRSLNNNLTAFKNDLLHKPGVSGATVSGFLPVNSSRSDNVFSPSPLMDSKNGFEMQVWGVDYDYFDVLGMHIIKGRAFSKDFGSDSSAVIINETAARILGFADPVGKKIYGPNGNALNQNIPYTIIGVVKNFNYESLRQEVGPLGLFLQPSTGLVSFKINGANIPDFLKEAENEWKSLAPGLPFSFRFLDESFNQMYRAEQRIGKIILLFSVLAIVIACLGLFGLSAFVAEQRTKEIGIRKTLGASVSGLVQLLSRDFIRLVAIAFVIAAPLSWWFMNRWLRDFAYRTDISWWIFLLAALLAFLIALFTVSFQALKAAMTNPVKSLRSE